MGKSDAMIPIDVLACVCEAYDAFFEDFEDDVLAEGSRDDSDVTRLHNKKRELIVKYKLVKKNVRRAIKAKDYKAAKQEVKELEKSISDAEALLQMLSNTTTIGQTILRFIGRMLLDFCRTLLLCFIPIIGHVAAGVINLRNLISDIAEIIAALDSGEAPEDAFDLYKTRLRGVISEVKKHHNRLITAIDEAEKAEKELAKEEVDDKKTVATERVKLSIFEACHNGKISEDVRDELLSKF